MWVSRGIELYPQNGGQAAVVDAWAVHGIWWIVRPRLENLGAKKRLIFEGSFCTQPKMLVNDMITSSIFFSFVFLK